MSMRKRFGVIIGVCAVVLVLSLTAVACSAKQYIQVSGLRRSYALHVPPSYAPGKPLPLVIALHHFTGSGAQMQEMTGFDAVADREKFIVAYPNGRMRRWNVAWDAGAKAQKSTPQDVAFIAALVEDLKATYTIDPDRVYAVGGSNGGMFAQLLPAALPGVFAAIAPAYTCLPEQVAAACEDMADPLPVVIVQGTEDPIIPWDRSFQIRGFGPHGNLMSPKAMVDFWAHHNGCNATPMESLIPDTDPRDGTTTHRIVYRPTHGQEDSARREVVLYRVEGGGHTWPGSRDSMPAWAVGRTANDFSASEAIWAFFKAHPRSTR